MSEKIEYLNISCTYRYQTAKAVLVMLGEDQQWIPKVCLSDASCNSVEAEEFSPGEDIELKVAKWFADKEGFN